MDLRYVRFIKGFTQQELGKASGVHQVIISNLERGYRKPTQNHIKKLSAALEITPETIDGWGDDNEE